MRKTRFIFTVLAILVAFSSCNPKSECDFCGKEKSCKTTILYDEEVNICDDCSAEIGNMFE